MASPVVELGNVFCAGFHAGETAGLRVWDFSYEPHQTIPYHEHQHAYVCFLTGGDFIETDSRDEITYSRARLVYLPKGHAHAARIGPDGAHAIGFELTDGFFDGDISPLHTSQRAIVMKNRRLFRMLHAVAMTCRNGTSSGYETSWPYEIAAELTTSNANDSAQWLSRVCDYIHEHATENPTPALLASVANRHPTHVMRVFRKRMGVPIGVYSHAVKIDRACQLIRQGGMSLTQISASLGYADQSHFVRSFRQAMGASPSAFRACYA